MEPDTEPDTDEPDTDELAEEPDTGEPDTEEPDTDEPDTEELAGEPDTEELAGEPDTDELAEELAEGIGAAVGGWTQRCVGEVMMAWRAQVPPEVAAAAAEAGRRAAAEVGAAARELLGSDIDEQRGTPLALVRAAVRYPSEVLAGAGAPPRQRDRFSAGRFPDDPYDLSPASWADVDPRLVELALAWGAAKAWEHKARHGPRPAGGAGR